MDEFYKPEMIKLLEALHNKYFTKEDAEIKNKQIQTLDCYELAQCISWIRLINQ